MLDNHSDESTDGIEKDTNAPYEASVRSSLSIFYWLLWAYSQSLIIRSNQLIFGFFFWYS